MDQNCLIVNTTSTSPVLLDHDCAQEFDLILFNFLDEDEDQLRRHWTNAGFTVSSVISMRTECKGQIFHHLSKIQLPYRFISVWDHDLKAAVSDINILFELGLKNDWHWYQPSLKPGSYNSFLWTMDYTFPEYWKDGIDCIYTYAPFVEQMCPFFSNSLWRHLLPVFDAYTYISGYGLDIYWIPEALTVFDRLTFPIVIKSVSITHTKAIESNGVIFSNGLTAGQEMDRCDIERYRLIKELYALDEWVDVQCISLDDPSCQDRKQRFDQAAVLHDFEYDFFPAVDLRSTSRFDYPDWIAHYGRRVDWYEPLMGGEAGVASSHKALYEKAFMEGTYALVVFEDDAVIIKPIDSIQIPEDADMLMISNRWDHNRYGEVIGDCCGFEGYIITRRGMYKMLQILQHMDMPIDLIAIAHCRSMIQNRHGLTTLRNVLNPILNIYHYHNHCIQHDAGVSTIKGSAS